MLIFLYIITALSALIDFHFFKIIGIFFGICYLPGLTLLALFKRDSLKIKDLILAYPASIGISSLFTLGLLYTGIHVGFIAYIIIGTGGFSLLIYAAKNKTFPSLTMRLSVDELRFVALAITATVVFSIPVISDRVDISHHGFHHFSLVTEIFNGFFPPENPGMGGVAIGYHWGYHALVAALSHPVDINPLRVISLLNIISLFFIICIAYRASKAFGITEGYSYLVPLALIGLMRSDAAIYYLRNLLAGSFPPVKNIASAPLNLLSSWVSGVSYLDTRLFFMNKFYNANNMPVGLCLIFSFFLILLHPMEENVKATNRKLYMTILAFVLTALAITYAFFLIAPLLFVPVWSVILFVTCTGNFREKLAQSFHLILPCVAAAAIIAPYLLIITSVNSVVTAGQSASEFKFIYLDVQAIRNIIVFLLPSPFIIAGLWLEYKRFAFSRKFLFLSSGSILFLLLSVFLRLNWSNSAKFSYILAFFFSFLFVLALSRFISFFSSIWLKRVMAGFIILYLLATPVITEAAYVCSPWFRDDTYSFRGIHVLFARDKSRNEAYKWIRDNTPTDALLILPYFDTPHGITIAEAISYRPAALSERSLFVVKDVYAYLLPEYKDRARMRKEFFRNPQNDYVKRFFVSLHRPVYLLVEEGYDDPLMEGVEFDQVPKDAGKALLPVFQNDRQKVYKVY